MVLSNRKMAEDKKNRIVSFSFAVGLLTLSVFGVGSFMLNAANAQQFLPGQQSGQTTNAPVAATTASDTGNATNTIDTFKARGTISSLAADSIVGSNTTLGSHSGDMFVLGGNWSYAVDKGNLSDIKVTIVMTKIDGSGKHTHTIDSLRNATGAVSPNMNGLIVLRNQNSTDIKGIADITTNGEVKWKDVPVIVHLLKGNVANFNIDPEKTDHHFKGLPVFGTVLSITDQGGKELKKE